MSFAAIAAAVGIGGGVGAAGAAAGVGAGVGAGAGAAAATAGAAGALGAAGAGAGTAAGVAGGVGTGVGAGVAGGTVAGTSTGLAGALGGGTAGTLGAGAIKAGVATGASQGLAAALKGGGPAAAQAASQAPQLGLRSGMGAEIADTAIDMGAPKGVANSMSEQFGSAVNKQTGQGLAEHGRNQMQQMSGMPDPSDQQAVMNSLEANKIQNEAKQAQHAMQQIQLPPSAVPEQIPSAGNASPQMLQQQAPQGAPPGEEGTFMKGLKDSVLPSDGKSAREALGYGIGNYGLNYGSGLATNYLDKLLKGEKKKNNRSTSAGRDSISSIIDLKSAMGPSLQRRGKGGQAQSPQALLQMLQQMGG